MVLVAYGREALVQWLVVRSWNFGWCNMSPNLQTIFFRIVYPTRGGMFCSSSCRISKNGVKNQRWASSTNKDHGDCANHEELDHPVTSRQSEGRTIIAVVKESYKQLQTKKSWPSVGQLPLSRNCLTDAEWRRNYVRCRWGLRCPAIERKA